MEGVGADTEMFMESGGEGCKSVGVSSGVEDEE